MMKDASLYGHPSGGRDGRRDSTNVEQQDATETASGRDDGGELVPTKQSRLSAMLAHAPTVLWAVDRSGRVTLAEGKGLACLGIEQPRDVLGMSVFDMVGSAPMDWLKRVLEQGEPFVGETKFLDPPRWYDTRCEPIRSTSGAIDGAIGISIDISERKQAEAERDRLFRAARRALLGERAARRRATFLAQASRVLASSLDQETTLLSIAHLVVPEMADGCVIDIVDPRGLRRPVVAYRDAEREAELADIAQRVEFGPDTAVGQVLASDEPFFEPRLDALSASAALGTRRDLLDVLRAVSLVCIAMRARGRLLGVLSLFTVADSGRRLEQDDVELAVDLALQAALAVDNARLYGEQTLAVQRRDEFLSVASHELRTPVTSLQLAIQALGRQQERSGMSTSTQTNMLRTAERQSKRLAQLVENLLDVSRIATGQLTMQLDYVDLAELARETATTSMAVDVEQTGCTIELDIGGPVVGLWDRVRLEQVITNLLSNAIKYGRCKPVELSVTSDGTVARLRVEDHGIGIPYDRQDLIFDRFERAVSARHYGGFGLGLYIVKQIVLALGGTITVESQPGVGAAFTVTLPLSGPPGKPEDRPSTQGGLHH
jgi:PAS domain S-box-containing protein